MAMEKTAGEKLDTLQTKQKSKFTINDILEQSSEMPDTAIEKSSTINTEVSISYNNNLSK